MLFPSEMFLKLFKENEFKVLIITGDHGFGKSSYADRIVSEVYSKDCIHANWTLDLFRGYKDDRRPNMYHGGHLGFHPAKVTDQWLSMERRDKVYHWDDAGLWLNAMDYQDPFVIAVGKYLQVARTDWAGLIFSCIDRDDVFSKLRNLRTAVVVEITKHSDKLHPNRRRATAYKYWRSRSGSKKGTKNLWQEDFDCYLPGNFCPDNPEWIANPSKEQKRNPNCTWGFYGWYEPRRAHYAFLAKKQMKHFLQKRHKELMEMEDELEI